MSAVLGRICVCRRMCTCVYAHACACLFLFAMETTEFGVFVYKAASPLPVWTGCNHKPGAYTEITGGQGGKWA